MNNKTTLEMHMKRFDVTYMELYDFINVLKRIDMTIDRIIYSIKNCDSKISYREYMFMYYTILEVDVCNHSIDYAYKLKGNNSEKQKAKYYKATRNHIPCSRGEGSKIKFSSEFGNYYY